MKNHRIYLLLVLGLFLVNWGNLGHKEISRGTAFFWPAAMNSFSFWADSLADRASDPDIRKYYNPDEGPKHFIDLDSYSEFLTKGKIPENKDSAIKIYGNSEVIDHGILPWAIMASFDSLKSCFKRGNWQKAVIFASDLGHYVADAHNPLHLTVNYNGQLSGQTGIHSRYESSMISRFVANINLKTETVNFIPEVKTYVFNFIYENFRFKDSILAADLYATNKVGSTSSESYYNELWNKSGYLTGKLFNKASKRLMELIYTAWVEAGSPAYGTSAVQENQVKNSMILKPAIYLSNNTLFFHIEEYEHVNVKICNLEGQVIKTLVDEEKPAGYYQLGFNMEELLPAVYICRMQAGKKLICSKIARF